MLRFGRNTAVPVINNDAVRDLRMRLVEQKVSGCYRGASGTVDHANLRVLKETASKWNWKVRESLGSNPVSLAAGLKAS